MLKIELDFVLDKFIREYFKKNVALRVLEKYKKDCLQFFHENNDKKIYCFDGCDTIYNAQFFTSLVCKSKVSNLLADDFQNQEVVIVKDGVIDKCYIFEERLNLIQKEAYLKELDNSIIKVICDDCIFIFLATVWEPFKNFDNIRQTIRNIVEKHNQSIEKGRRLLMELEGGEKSYGENE